MDYQLPPPGMAATPSFPPPQLPLEPPSQQQDPASSPVWPPPPTSTQQQQPVYQATSSPFAGSDIYSVKTACEFSVGEYATLQRRIASGGGSGGGPSYDRLRAQAAIAASDLRVLRGEVAVLLKAAEGHRWRKWLIGGIIATIIPAVRKLFRRPASSSASPSQGGEVAASNDTEHAFRKSKSLISRILHATASGTSRLASVAFFVLAVLYVFQSEVSMRVARTVSRRLKKLVAKVERGDEDVRDEDLKVLKGWRWRVLLW